MLHFLTRRLLLLLFVIWGISLVTFVLARVVPTDPARLIAGPRAGPAAVAVVRHDYGLDRPLVEQYLTYMAGLFSGDLGRSFTTKRPVTDDLRAFFPATVELTLASLLIALALGLPIGIVAAVRRNSALDYAGRSFATFGLSLPPFWIGLLAQLLFYSGLTLLPVGGRLGQDVLAPPALTGLYTIDSLLVGQFATFLDALRHLVLPAVVLSFSTTAVFVRLVRAALLEELRQDYVRTARAKGLRERAVIVGHALRNALIPATTLLGLSIGGLMGGTVILEKVFSLPGAGALLIDSIGARDYPVVQAATLIFATLVILINLITDIVYSFLDPRVRFG